MKRNPFIWKTENCIPLHHLYIGLLLLGWNYPINVIGLLIALDDLYEHLIDYNSPLRIFFDKVLVPIIWR